MGEVTLAALSVTVAWSVIWAVRDVAIRFIEAHDTASELEEAFATFQGDVEKAEADITARLDAIEASLLASKNKLADLTSFLSASRKR